MKLIVRADTLSAVLRLSLGGVVMVRLREEFDSDLIQRNRSSDYRSTTNCYEIPCSVCGKILFVDEDTKADFDRAETHDLDNRFTCYECEQEYDRLAFE